ncbi:IclR family transcriptional regulator C-terminal domain-containing protein [Paraburkholderia fungorum]|uniref:IclR family transcriptional regulator C-terminal domain-containing protein n=1 Tax=Paraburkholderia fungorum TaxID=134537 RepID=UPI001C1E9B5F|nr:hypothetical protein [Paraburkholderia fungorum]
MLIQDIEQIRLKGFGTSHHELFDGAVAVVAPFFNGTNRFVGSRRISRPSVRVPEQPVEQSEKLRELATVALSRPLGRQVS